MTFFTTKRLALFTCLALVAGFGVGQGVSYIEYRLDRADSPVEVIEARASYAFDAEDPRRLAGWSDHIFVGRVVDQIDTVKRQSVVPFTLFTVDVSEGLKGQTSANVVVAQEGGYDAEEGALVLTNNDPLLEVGKEYLFVTRMDKANGWYRPIPLYGDLLLEDVQQKREITDGFRQAVAQQIPFRLGAR